MSDERSSAVEQRSRRLAMVVRQALLMIVAAIEREFGLQRKSEHKIVVEVREYRIENIDES